MTVAEKIRSEISGAALPLVAFCVALNLTAGQITVALKIPIYLDSIGTILVAVLCGPWAGMVTGTVSNVMAGAIGSPAMIFFAPVSMVIGVFTGYLAALGWFKRWYLVVVGGILMGIVSAFASAPISAYLFGGTMMAGTDALVIFFRSMGNNILQSVLFQGISSDPVDKTISYLIVFALIRNLPVRILHRFKGAGNVVTAHDA